MPTPDALIRTKLRPPFIRTLRVARPRLQERLIEGLRGPLTLIIAPAGFGKTTLAASCVADCGMRVAWITLDKVDNQPGRFLSYLVTALHGANPHAGSPASQMLSAIPQPLPEAVLTSLVNDLDRLDQPIVLVLDDFQQISSPAVHEQVVFLLEHCPVSLHIVITTRSDPPFPVARLRARDQIVEIRASDLRFTEPEAAQFLNQVMQLNLDLESIAALDARTEGWIAGLQMAALSLRDRVDVRSFIDGFSGTNRFILDYLLEEILVHQPPDIQEFLRCTSILERFTAPLCDALLEAGADGAQRAAAVLEYLERENTFLVSLDSERTWFRYHNLFADLLRARLQQTQPERITHLHQRASAWLARQNLIPEAIQHLLAAGDENQAADLIEQHAPAFWAAGDLSVIQMADNLSSSALMNRPKIGLNLAWLLICQGNVERVVPLLNELGQQLRSPDFNAGAEWMQFLTALALAFLGVRENTWRNDPLSNDRLLDEIPVDEVILRDAANMLFVMTLGRRGDSLRAAQVASRLLQREKASLGKPGASALALFLARLYLLLGRLQDAASLCHAYLDDQSNKGIPFLLSAGGLNIVLGEVFLERNRLDEAEQHIRSGIQANGAWIDIMSDAFGKLALMRLLQAKGDIAGALRVADEFENRLANRFRPHEFEEEYRTIKIRLLLAGGNTAAAADWADRVLLSQDFALHPDIYRLTLARIRLAQGEYTDIERFLTGLTPPESAGNPVTRQIECRLVLAASLAAKQRLPEALQMVDDCLALAEPEGYLRIFFEIGKPAKDLLSAYLHQNAGIHSLYAKKILAALSALEKPNSLPAPSKGLVEPLSTREIEVLRLMSIGKTNAAIARQLVVATGTIKAHAATIFRKLDVANRTEAVDRARQLGILS